MVHKNEIQTHTFPNGFRVVYQKSIQALPITTIYTFCKVGSAYETDRVRGASHFVEHMCFKGTHKRQEARDILKQYDEIGAFFNAYTEKRFTAYMVKCDDKYVRHCSEILGDMLMNSMFPRKEFDKEQKVVVEESIKGMNDDEYMLQERMDQIIYRGSSYEYPIDCLKYHPSPNFLQYSDIFEWYHWFYHPSNMVFSITSNLAFSTILSMLKKTDFVKKDRHFTQTKPVFVLENPVLALSPISTTKKIKEKHVQIEFYQKKGVSTDILNIAFRTCSRFSQDKYALQILKHILNGLSGKLFTALRTKHGLTYNSVCEVEYYEHTGYLAIQIQTDPNKIIQDNHHIGVLPIVIDLLKDLKKKGVTTEDLQVAKGNIQGKYLLSMQSMDTMTEYNGIESVYQETESEFGSKIVPYSKIYDTFLADLSKKDIHEIIRKYFVRENLVVGIMYETGINKKKIEEICDVFI